MAANSPGDKPRYPDRHARRWHAQSFRSLAEMGRKGGDGDGSARALAVVFRCDATFTAVLGKFVLTGSRRQSQSASEQVLNLSRGRSRLGQLLSRGPVLQSQAKNQLKETVHEKAKSSGNKSIRHNFSQPPAFGVSALFSTSSPSLSHVSAYRQQLKR